MNGFQSPSKVEAVNNFTDHMKSTLDEARAALAKSKDDMARYYNQHRTPAPKFVMGDKVFLDALDISMMRPSKKFTHRYLGPYPIIHSVGSHAYHLRLPPSMSRLHPVFHVVKLMPTPLDQIAGWWPRPQPTLEMVGGEKRYEVKEVISSQMRGRMLQFLVRWKGYGCKENSWIIEGDLDVPQLIQDFYWTNPTAPKQINALLFGCMGFQPRQQCGSSWCFSHWDAAPWRGVM